MSTFLEVCQGMGDVLVVTCQNAHSVVFRIHVQVCCHVKVQYAYILCYRALCKQCCYLNIDSNKGWIKCPANRMSMLNTTLLHWFLYYSSHVYIFLLFLSIGHRMVHMSLHICAMIMHPTCPIFQEKVPTCMYVYVCE